MFSENAVQVWCNSSPKKSPTTLDCFLILRHEITLKNKDSFQAWILIYFSGISREIQTTLSEMSPHFLYDSDLAGNIQSVVIWCKPYISLLLSIRPVKNRYFMKNCRSYLLEKMYESMQYSECVTTEDINTKIRLQ